MRDSHTLNVLCGHIYRFMRIIIFQSLFMLKNAAHEIKAVHGYCLNAWLISELLDWHLDQAATRPPQAETSLPPMKCQ
jgi:hypothetical protein